MQAFLETYPIAKSIKNELTLLITIITVVITSACFTIIFGNTNALHTSDKSIWLYDLFSIIFFIINVILWLLTYREVFEDSHYIHLIFFLSPFILMIWGSIIVANISMVIIKSLWILCFSTFVTSIIICTLFGVLIVEEIKQIRLN